MATLDSARKDSAVPMHSRQLIWTEGAKDPGGCGGAGGYAEYCESWQMISDPEHESMRESGHNGRLKENRVRKR